MSRPPHFTKWILLLCLICLVTISIINQPAQLFKTSTPPLFQPYSQKKQPFPNQTGLRIANLRAKIPTIDRIVLVPDEATFLAAIEHWSLKGRWPILIEDDQYTPMFIRRFHPNQVIRLPSVGTPLPKGEEFKQRLQRATAMAWNPAKGESLTQTWQRLGWRPPGVVVTQLDDPAWPAAIALATDRGQPLAFLDGDFGSPNGTLNPDQWQLLQTGVQQAVEQTGYAYESLGDDIDTVTIVRQLAVKYQHTENVKQILAVTDGLARHPDGQRWAIVGWIYGSSVKALYQAMCSIFLSQETALLYNSYPMEGVWGMYAMGEPAEQLRKVGFDVTLIQRPQAGVKNWRDITNNSLDFDLIFVNTKGSSSSFDLGDGDASVEDVPTLNIPAAMHFIHSWSAVTPDDRNTVAGRWLSNGVYAYVGSVDEPYVQAFVTPQLLAFRLQILTPFLIAARQIEAPPWKITTIGDPLMTILKLPPRVKPTPQITDDITAEETGDRR